MARVAITFQREDAAANPSDGIKYCLTPIPPTLSSGGTEMAAGLAVAPALDAVITDEQIIDTLNASGEATVMLVPEADTLRGADGRGLMYRLTFGPNAETLTTPHVTFGAPSTDERLDDFLTSSIAAAGALQKRPWDQRVMTVDLTDVIADEDTTVSAVSMIEMVDDDSGVTLTEQTRHDKAVSFLAAGGVVGLWAVRVQVSLSGDPTERLEVVVPLMVSAA